MTTPAPSPANELSRPAHDREARLLSDVLRASRLVLLFGQPGSDKTAFVRDDLMPALHRRASDHAAPSMARESGVVVPFADRRRQSPAGASRRPLELIVYFDHWVDAPLAALQSSIRSAAGTVPAGPTEDAQGLTELLVALSGQLDAGFIIVLDRFEEFLQAPAHRADIVRFSDELVASITRAQLPVNFLISLDEQARAGLARFSDRIPGFADCSLTLSRPVGLRSPASSANAATVPDMGSAATVPTLTEAVAPTTAPSRSPAESAPAYATGRIDNKPKVKLPPLTRMPVTTEQVYALIETTLAHTANQADLARAAERSRMYLGRVHESVAHEGSLTNTIDTPRGASNAAPATQPGSARAAWTRGIRLGAMIDWLARRLRRRAPDA